MCPDLLHSAVYTASALEMTPETKARYRVLAVATGYPAGLLVEDQSHRLFVYLTALGTPGFEELAAVLLASETERFYRRVSDPAWYSLDALASWCAPWRDAYLNDE